MTIVGGCFSTVGIKVDSFARFEVEFGLECSELMRLVQIVVPFVFNVAQHLVSHPELRIGGE